MTDGNLHYHKQNNSIDTKWTIISIGIHDIHSELIQ